MEGADARRIDDRPAAGQRDEARVGRCMAPSSGFLADLSNRALHPGEGASKSRLSNARGADQRSEPVSDEAAHRPNELLAARIADDDGMTKAPVGLAKIGQCNVVVGEIRLGDSNRRFESARGGRNDVSIDDVGAKRRLDD